jgi:chromosome segregation ATPase
VGALDGRKRELEEETRRMSKHERRLGAELERLGAREEALVKEVQRLATHEAQLAATVEQLKGTSHPEYQPALAAKPSASWHQPADLRAGGALVLLTLLCVATAAHERALDADTESLHSMLAQAQAQVAQLTAEGKAAAACADTAQAAEADLRRQLADLQRRVQRHEDETVANTDRVRLDTLGVPLERQVTQT